MEDNLEIYKNLLDPGFPFDKYDQEVLDDWALDLVARESIKQKALGKIADITYKRGGKKALTHLAYIADMPRGTLFGYMKVIQRLEEGDIKINEVPEDIEWAFLKVIAWTQNPKETLDTVLAEGLGRIDLLDKLGKKSAKHKVICPTCSTEQNVHPVCLTCGNTLDDSPKPA